MIALTALGLEAAGAAQAAEAPAVTLPEVSVTATRGEQDMTKVPGRVTVISREEIEALHPQTVTEVLKAVPGLVVRDFTGTGAVSTVDLRGFGGTGALHTLVTVDGRRRNQIDLSGVDFTTIPVENIERIEILHGPGGVLYGNNAVGGVVNIVTKEGAGKPGGKLEALAGSYGMWGVRSSVQGGEDKASWFVSVREDSNQGYRANSETRLRNATFNTRYYATDTLSFLLDGVASQANYSLPGSLAEAQYNRDPRASYDPNKWAKNKDAALRGQVRKDFISGEVLTTDFSYRQRRAVFEIWSHRESDIGTLGLQPKYVLDGSLAGLGNRLTTGMDFFSWDVNSNEFVIHGLKKNTIDYQSNSAGLYLLEELSLTKALVLSLGGRLQNNAYDIVNQPVGKPQESRSSSDDQYACSAGLAYSFVPGSKLFGRLSRTFRYPTVEEYVTYGKFVALSPEKVMNYEVGGEYIFVRGGKVSLTAYYMQMKDEIAYNPAAMQNENLDETEHRGVEAGLRVPLSKKVQAFGSLTYQQARFSTGANEGNHLPLVPDWAASAGLSVEIVKDLQALARVNYMGERPFGNDRANAFGDLGTVTTVDLHLNYKWGNMNFFLNVDNLLDERYAYYAYAGSWGKSFYPSPSATVWGGVGISF